MSIAVAQDVIDLGFDKIQFGEPADFTVYVTEVIDDIALQVAALVGATAYAATAGSVEEMRLKHAEKNFAASELWRRIELFERRSARKSRTDGDEAERSRPQRNAVLADDMGWRYLMYFGVNKETDNIGSLAVGFNESSTLPASAA